VTNLCQFLPQEKVSEFARLNSEELLENTEKAVGGIELYEKHNELKNQREKSREFEQELKATEDTLRKEEAINSRLENQVSSFIEKKKFEENIKWLKRKRAIVVSIRIIILIRIL
jgi:structural maintenance of chromosomes protein 5